MKTLIFFYILTLSFTLNTTAQEQGKDSSKQFMQITTVESVIGGGLGRSRLFITNPDGSQEEKELNNLFSLGGINFKNIKENENTIVKILKQYADQGWKIDHAIPLTLSPPDNGAGIFMTRYLLSKLEVKKGF